MSVKQASKRKRVAKAAVPALGAAGLTFSLAGGASASTLPNADTPQKLNFSPSQSVLLGEEEIADVSLATFHLFDKENARQRRLPADGLGLPLRWLPWLPRLPWLSWLPLRRLRWRSVLCVMGLLPALLSRGSL